MKLIHIIAIGIAVTGHLLVTHIAHAGEVADSVIEKTLGTSGVQHHSKTHQKYGMNYVDVTYQDQQGKALVAYRHGTAEQFDLWQQVAGPEVVALPGIGVAAFQYKTLRTVCAKTATAAACVTPDYLTQKDKISDTQLQTLLKAAL